MHRRPDGLEMLDSASYETYGVLPVHAPFGPGFWDTGDPQTVALE